MKSKLPLLLIGAALALSAQAATYVPSVDTPPGIAFDNLETSAYDFKVEITPEPQEALAFEVGKTIESQDFFDPALRAAPVAPDYVFVVANRDGPDHAQMLTVRAREPEPFEFDFDQAMKDSVPQDAFGLTIAEPSTLSFAALGILPFLRRHR